MFTPSNTESRGQIQNLTQVYGQSPEVVSTGETDQNACSSVELKSGQMKAPHRNGIVISGYNSLQCAIQY